MRIITMSFLVALTSLLHTTTMAHPNVFFADSKSNGYLINEIDNDYIKFKMSNNSVKIVIPNKAYDFDKLIAFVNSYQFDNENLKDDFKQMFEMSFYSTSDAVTFLKELVSILEAFKAKYPQDVQ